MFMNASGRIKAAKGDIWDVEALRHLFSGREGFGREDKIQRGMCHRLEVAVSTTSGKLADVGEAESTEDGEEVAVRNHRREVAENVEGL